MDNSQQPIGSTPQFEPQPIQPMSPAPQTEPQAAPQPATQPTEPTLQQPAESQPIQSVAETPQPESQPTVAPTPEVELQPTQQETSIQTATPKKKTLPIIPIVIILVVLVAAIVAIRPIANLLTGSGTKYNASNSEISDAQSDIMKYLNDRYSADFTLSFRESSYTENDGGIGVNKDKIYFHYTATSSLLPGETFDISCVKHEATKSSPCEIDSAPGYSSILLKKAHSIISEEAVKILKPTIPSISVNASSPLYVTNQSELDAGESNILSLTNLDGIKDLQRILSTAKVGKAADYYAELGAEISTPPEAVITFANYYSLRVSSNAIFVIYNNDMSNKAKVTSVEDIRTFVTKH